MTESIRYFGHFFHHWPEDPREQHDNSGYEATLKAYKEAFGSEPNAVWVGDKQASKDAAGCGAKCGALDSNTNAKSNSNDTKSAGCGSKCGAKESSDMKGGCGAKCGAKAGCGAKCGSKDTSASPSSTAPSEVKAGCGSKCGSKCKGASASDMKGGCGAKCGAKPSEFTAQPGKCGSRCGASRCNGGKSSTPTDPNAEARLAAYMKKVAAAEMGMNCSSCSGSSCTGGMSMNMRTSFGWFQDTVVLWDSWRTDTDGKYAGTIIAILIIMLVKEALFHKRVEIARQGMSQGPAVGSSSTVPSGATGGGLSVTWKLRLINAVLGGINLTLGYFIMLIVMTYNNGFFIAVILGGALAQFLFSVPWTETAHADGAVEVDCCEQ